MLQVTLISCVLKDKFDVVKCTIKLPNKDSETLQANFDEDKNPFWNKPFSQELSLQSQVFFYFIKLNVLVKCGLYLH